MNCELGAVRLPSKTNFPIVYTFANEVSVGVYFPDVIACAVSDVFFFKEAV